MATETDADGDWKVEPQGSGAVVRVLVAPSNTWKIKIAEAKAVSEANQKLAPPEA